MQPAQFSSSRQLGALVRAARVRAGLTQADLAERAGLERQWVVLFENGRVANPLLANVLAVVDAAGLRLQVAEAASEPDLDGLLGVP